jgi:hypothetical protein
MAGTPGTSMSATGQQTAKAQPTQWGKKGISERFYVQDSSLTETPNTQQIILADAGLLSELQHHHYGTYTITHGTGTNGKDAFGPYTALNQYVLQAGSNTPIISISGRALGILQVIEYPDRSFEANATPIGVESPLTNSSDYFNYPSTTGTMRWWARIPVALKITGAPGGYVAYMVLQNKRVANVIKPSFNLSGVPVAGAYTAASSANGNAAYVVTGNDTVTAAPIFETWKTLNTVPSSRANMPLFGFTRYIYETLQPYSGSSFTYNFEPGGELLRATFQFIDGAANTGMATANLNQIAYQYGTNKQMDVYTPYRNIHQQLLDYGRVLPQGTFVFDYYTPTRSLVNTKSTENTANVQVVAQFASTYSVPANSQCSIMTDKVFAVQNYLAK